MDYQHAPEHHADHQPEQPAPAFGEPVAQPADQYVGHHAYEPTRAEAADVHDTERSGLSVTPETYDQMIAAVEREPAVIPQLVEALSTSRIDTPPAAAADEPEAPAAGRGARGGVTRAQMRRIIAKHTEVLEAPEATRAVAAAIIGCTPAPADLALTILCSTRAATAPVNDLRTIRNADPMEAGVEAATMGKDRIKSLWALLVALEVIPRTALPASDAKAAVAVAKAIHGIDEIVTSELDEAIALLKKS